MSSVVGSTAHRRVPEGGIQFDNLAGEGWIDQAYGHSKLANGLYSLELSKRLGVTGQYFADCNPAEQSEYQQDEAMAARLWEVSEELAGDYLV